MTESQIERYESEGTIHDRPSYDPSREKEVILIHPTRCASRGCDGRTTPGERYCDWCQISQAEERRYWEQLEEYEASDEWLRDREDRESRI